MPGTCNGRGEVLLPRCAAAQEAATAALKAKPSTTAVDSTPEPLHRVRGCSIPKQPQAPVLPFSSYIPCRKRGGLAQQEPAGTSDAAKGDTSEPGVWLCHQQRRSEGQAAPPRGQSKAWGAGGFAAGGRVVGHKSQICFDLPKTY